MLGFYFSLYGLLKAAVLVCNAGAILNEKRFLRKCTSPPRFRERERDRPADTARRRAPPHDRTDGWDRPEQDQAPTIKSQIVTLLYAVRTVMQLPLITLNIFIIFVEVLFG